LAIPIGIAAATLPSPEVKPKEAFSAYFRNSMAILRKGKLLFEFISGAAVFIVLYGSFLLYLTFLLKDAYAADPCVIGVLLSSMSVFTAIFASKLGCFVKILGSVRTIGLGFACYSISMLLVPFIPSLPYFILVTFLFGLGHGTVLPALQNLVVSTAPMEYRAVVMTTYGSAIRIGQTAGPTIASISAFYSLNTVFFVSAIITALLAIAYCFVKD
jgi:MFS family permease